MTGTSTKPATRNRLRDERIRRGWSQTRLSGLTGIAQSDISALEHGKRYLTPGWRARIAAAMGISESDLHTPESL